METVKKRKTNSIVLLTGLLVYFLGMLLFNGVGIYNDSEQYITMHIHREPLYPLFLAFFRTFMGKGYLTAAAVVQSAAVAYGIYLLSEYLTGHFALKIWQEYVLVGIQLLPHLMTRYISALHIFLENSVMSEALCIPLFQFYLYFVLRMLFDGRKRDLWLSLLFAYLLSLTRGQMMVTILVWMLIVMVRQIIEKRYRKLLLPVLVVLLTFGLRSLTTHVYNYAVTGYFMGNTYGKVNTLTNVIYACDKEDGEVFPEGSLERRFFEQFYEQADAMKANYRYGGDTFRERAEHLEECHDALKFQVLEANLSAYYFGLGEVDYYEQSSMSDEMAGIMLQKLLPVCLGQWLYDYVLLCTYGFIRSIAVVHPAVNPVAWLLYVLAVILVVRELRLHRSSDRMAFMGVALLFIIGNVCAASLTIMCLSRYMIYGFAPFYMALFLLLIQWIEDRKENKRINRKSEGKV